MIVLPSLLSSSVPWPKKLALALGQSPELAALVQKSGKSASHIYARLSLLQLIPALAEAFVEERITDSHANLIARLPQERQQEAFNIHRRSFLEEGEHQENRIDHVKTFGLGFVWGLLSLASR